MQKIEHLYELMSQSPITTIGFTFKYERLKDDIISKLNYIDCGEIDTSTFSLKSLLRDIKINSLLNEEKNPEYILIDLMNLKFDISKHSRARTIQKLVIQIQDELFNIYEENQKIKLIFTTSLNSSYVSSLNSHYVSDEDNSIPNFFGGTDTLYVSSLVFTISDNIKILKNRFDETKSIQLW
jgi:hypothetical protein